MKRTLGVVAVVGFAAVAASAGGTTVKECTASIKKLQGEGTVDVVVTIFSDKGALRAKVGGAISGEEDFKEYAAELVEAPVREGVTSLGGGLTEERMRELNLNRPELMILITNGLESSPELGRSGVDLAKVRSAKAYVIAMNLGFHMPVGIIEAKDAGGNDLGSYFLGGMLLGACK